MFRAMVSAFAVSLAAATPAAAQPDRPRVTRVEVQLSNFAFAPSTIHLRAGEPVVLHLVNASSGGHDFAAPEFFAAATLLDSRAIEHGRIELGSHQVRDISLVPKAGHYPLKCTHTFHKMFGMSGEIVVD
jgi:plastocyanin